jgi:CrcB protein
MSAAVWIGVAAVGSLGTLARFLLDGWISSHSSRGLPLGTLVVNTSGALLLGVVAGVALTGDALLLVGTATIGSYTTFSTWMFETHRLGEDGQSRAAVANVLISVVLGVAAVLLGRAIGELL